MALQYFSIAAGAFNDNADGGGNNYIPGVIVEIQNLNGTLASIFSDEAGTTPITQDGVSNVTGSNGVFSFFIDAGNYRAVSGGNEFPFSVGQIASHLLLADTDAENSHPSTAIDFTPYSQKTLIGEGTGVDAMPQIEAALSVVDHVHLVGDFEISSLATANFPDKKITGVRGITTISFTSALESAGGAAFPLERSQIFGITFVGSLSQTAGVGNYPDPEDDSYFDTIDDALAYADTLGFSAVKLFTNQSKIDNCEFKYINGYAVETAKNNVGTNANALDTGVRNCRILRNLGAINILEESEYMKFNNNSIGWNIIGVNKRGGNNTFTGNNIDHNRVNFITRAGANNSHGGITGGTMNHGKLAALIADEITVGEAIYGVNLFDSGTFGVYIRNSIGVNMTCNFGRTNVYCVGQGVNAANPGVNNIRDSQFNLHGVTYQIYRNWNEVTQQSDPATPDNCIFRDNYHMEGQSAKDGSGWDEVDLNDTIAPDSDGFTSQQTIDGGDNNSRIVSGRPLDGTQYLGNGNQTGAIRIKCPVPGFNNSNTRFRITVRTSNRLGCKIDFNSFMLSGGNWGNTVPYDVEGTNYKVRLGRDTSGQPLIYIGELTTSFSSAVVEIEFFSMHSGIYSESKHWKYNWEITQETSAFENVSDEFWGDVLGFDGDLNTIDYDSEIYVKSTATNNPDGVTGWCKTKARSAGSGIRMQEYTESVTDKLYIRTTQTGDAGWTTWKEK